MRLPGPASLFFLLVIVVLLPLAAIRSRRFFRGAGDAAPPLPSRASIWARAMATQAILLALAWSTGATFGYRILGDRPPGRREWLMAALALAVCLALQWLVRATRSDAERRDLAVVRLAPQGGREWALWGATVGLASVAEEAAYRGVGMAIAWHMTGDARLAAVVMAAAFAAAHAIQGFKSGVVIFAVALVMHALVQSSGTLLTAMAVHAAFDVAAGFLLAREAGRMRQAPIAPLSDSTPTA